MTLIIPQSIWRDADIAMFIAKFPYIIEFTVVCAGPAEFNSIIDTPTIVKEYAAYHLFSFNEAPSFLLLNPTRSCDQKIGQQRIRAPGTWFQANPEAKEG